MVRKFVAQSVLLLSALCCGPGVSVALTPEQRVKQEVNAVLVRLLANGEVTEGDLAAMRLQHEGGRVARFGALMDFADRKEDPRGVEVVAVTPGSSAETLGLVPGDRILQVNGVAVFGTRPGVEGVPDTSEVIRQQLDAAPDDISLLVERSGRELLLTGPVLSVELPPYRLDLGSAVARSALGGVAGEQQGCGRISVFDVSPRSRDLFPAVLIAIDGKAPGPAGRTSFRVDPGLRRLTVAEAIDDYEFSGVQQRQRRLGGSDRYLELFVEVEVGRTYRLAAEFDGGKAGSLRPGSYWRPVIWSVSEEACN